MDAEFSVELAEGSMWGRGGDSRTEREVNSDMCVQLERMVEIREAMREIGLPDNRVKITIEMRGG